MFVGRVPGCMPGLQDGRSSVRVALVFADGVAWPPRGVAVVEPYECKFAMHFGYPSGIHFFSAGPGGAHSGVDGESTRVLWGRKWCCRGFEVRCFCPDAVAVFGVDACEFSVLFRDVASDYGSVVSDGFDFTADG